MIRIIDAREAATLIDELDAYQSALYPAESNHLDSIEELARECVHMLGAFDAETLCAMGAVKIFVKSGYGELKRLWVTPSHRGRGLARKIMDALETHLVEHGVPVAKLETGSLQPEALALYRSLGYTECAPFGDYVEDPLSVYMSKDLHVRRNGRDTRVLR